MRTLARRHRRPGERSGTGNWTGHMKQEVSHDRQ